MRIVILPIVKFIVAIILTMVIFVIDLLTVISFICWYFKLPKIDYWEYKNKVGDIDWSPFHTRMMGHDSPTFKSLYHYIWNVYEA